MDELLFDIQIHRDYHITKQGCCALPVDHVKCVQHA